MGRVRKGIQSLMVLVLAVASLGVSAMPINGELQLIGGLRLLEADGITETTDVTQAATIDFLIPFASVMSASGDFDTITDTFVSIKNIAINPFTGPISEFWTFGTGTEQFSFSLDSLTTLDPTPPGVAFLMEGSGTIRHAAFDDTQGFWTLTADTTPNTVRFAWNATTGVPVPEPNVLMLVGLGLVVIGAFKTRRAT